MNIKQTLMEKLDRQLEKLDTLEYGSAEYRGAVDDIAKLADKLNDMERIEREYEEKAESRKDEKDYKAKQRKLDIADLIAKHSLTAAALLVGVGMKVWGTNKSLKFEETGTVTTFAGREWLKELFSKKQ